MIKRRLTIFFFIRDRPQIYRIAEIPPTHCWTSVSFLPDTWDDLLEELKKCGHEGTLVLMQYEERFTGEIKVAVFRDIVRALVLS